MTIRVTGRSDETYAAVQQEPLTQSLYVPPHGRPGDTGGDTRRPSRRQPPAPASPAVPSERPSPPAASSRLEPHPVPAPPRPDSGDMLSRSLWAIAAGLAIIVASGLFLLYQESNPVARQPLQPAPQEAGLALAAVDEMTARLNQAEADNQVALDQLQAEVERLQHTAAAQSVRPTWRWHAAPTAADNPMRTITLEMHGVAVEGKNMVARVSNLRTGQSLLVVLGPAGDHYHGVFPAFHDMLPFRLDMLSLQVNDPVYVEWLADFPTPPTLMTVDAGIVEPPALAASVSGDEDAPAAGMDVAVAESGDAQ